MSEKANKSEKKSEKCNSDNITSVILTLITSFTCLMIFVINGEYNLKAEALRGRLRNGVRWGQ